MIELCLHDYITAPADLTGTSDTEAFANAIVLGNMTIENRNDARRFLRNRIGHRVYAGRRLEKQGHAAITLRRISGSPEYHLKGDDRTSSVVQVDAFSKGDRSAIEIMLVSELFRIAVSGYRGTWGRETKANVATVHVERTGMTETSPKDSTGYWTHRMSTDYLIIYHLNLVEV